MRGTANYRSGGMNISYQFTPWVKRLLIANTIVFVLAWALGGGFVLE